jgi:hypothetical protein
LFTVFTITGGFLVAAALAFTGPEEFLIGIAVVTCAPLFLKTPVLVVIAPIWAIEVNWLFEVVTTGTAVLLEDTAAVFFHGSLENTAPFTSWALVVAKFIALSS